MMPFIEDYANEVRWINYPLHEFQTCLMELVWQSTRRNCVNEKSGQGEKEEIKGRDKGEREREKEQQQWQEEKGKKQKNGIREQKKEVEDEQQKDHSQQQQEKEEEERGVRLVMKNLTLGWLKEAMWAKETEWEQQREKKQGEETQEEVGEDGNDQEQEQKLGKEEQECEEQEDGEQEKHNEELMKEKQEMQQGEEEQEEDEQEKEQERQEEQEEKIQEEEKRVEEQEELKNELEKEKQEEEHDKEEQKGDKQEEEEQVEEQEKAQGEGDQGEKGQREDGNQFKKGQGEDRQKEDRQKKTTRKKDNTLESNTDKVETKQRREEERGGEQQTQVQEGEDGWQRGQDGNGKEDKENTPQQSSREKEPPPLLRQKKNKHQQVKTENDWQKERKEEQEGDKKRQEGDKEKMKAVKKEDEKMQEERTTQVEKKEEQTFEVENPDRQLQHCHTTSQRRRPGLKRLQVQDLSWKAVKDLMLLVVLLFGPLVSATPVSVSLHVEGRGRTLQGESYSLVCVVTPPQAAHTSPAFSWYRNGKQLDHQTNQVLRLRPLTKSDEGDYRCHLKSEDATSVLISSPFSLTVIVLENISLVPEVEVEEGQTVILNCSVHSDPTAFLTWRLGGKTLYTVRSNSDSLVLHNASQYHLQVVECEAYNNGLILGFLDAYSLIRLKGTYEVIPTPHLFWKGDTVLHHRFALECIVGELPNQGVNVHLTYTWYRDDKVMEGQSDMILDFPSLRKEDSGLYTCTARNGKPRTTSLESKYMEVVVLIPPVVHIEPRTPDNVITQAAGETLTLTCKVTEAFPGVAPDGYRWSYLPSPGGQLRPLEGRESTLTLGPLTREDGGQYICQAWNYEDFDGLLPPGNASVTVEIWYLKDIKLTSDVEVNEGDHVTLTCSVDSNPAARLSWWVEGREVRHVTANVDYVLERAACSDNKTYTCHASIPHLPHLEIMRSSHVLVHCQEKRMEALPSSASPALEVAFPVSISILVIVVIIVCF